MLYRVPHLYIIITSAGDQLLHYSTSYCGEHGFVLVQLATHHGKGSILFRPQSVIFTLACGLGKYHDH